MDKLHIRLAKERKRVGLTQAKMAEIAGLSFKTQNLYEAGKRFPDARYLQAAEKHGIDTHYVLHGTRRPTRTLYVPTEADSKQRLESQFERMQAALDSANWAISEVQRQLKEIANG